MAGQKQRGRPTDPTKMVLWCRIDAKAIAELDALAGNMKPQPSRAQLIDLAVQEYVDRMKVIQDSRVSTIPRKAVK